ncbi:unnamed protein product [Kuraishia capsulata CBS 1993]|uniref:CCAAT-binding factor domain-containing protein n=1 Tax=Kuraishia capsulata CBS 1993 TaxID=1382522 RepID=W6MXS5_9ASCO|nr:uncharacterized protein KUCA_T00005388001 [Kuraishia capsulata CBS 1993]CDK29400.1 unnamed protein product [Kuraishia capsulata CBS 1993]
MESLPSLNLSSLRDKIANKLTGEKPKAKGGKQAASAKQTNPNQKAPKPAEKSSKPVAKPQAKTAANLTEQDDVLRREALELGATEEDLKLLNGLSDHDDLSEEEFEDDGKSGDGLQSDVSKFMKELGLDGTIPDVVSDVEEEEEAEVEPEIESEAEVQQSDEEDPVQESDKSEEPEKLSQPPQQEDFKKKSGKVTELQNVITDKLVVPARNDWYNVELPPAPDAERLTQHEIDSLYKKAERIVQEENDVYAGEFAKSSSQKRFLSQVLTSGTLNDKISALTLLVQEAPLHNTKAIANLIGMCEKKARTAALQSITAVVDLMVNGVLPDRKLRYFKNQPLSNSLSKTQLAIFYFEDFLKKEFFKLISILEILSHDTIVHVRTKTVGYIFELLKAKPEQEANLLRLGVNKLGDIDNKVSSKTSYQVLQLEQQHPAMKKIIVDAVIDILFRKKNEHHAMYYSVLTLNQTILTRREEELANSLCRAYFSIFEKLLLETDPENISTIKATEVKDKKRRNAKKGKKGGKSVKSDKSDVEIAEEKNSKLFSAVLTGLNRSFPFSNLPLDVFESHLEALFKITHSTNFNTSVQALILIHSVTSKKGLGGDRYYRTLYESLLDTRLLTSSKQGIYLNLLFKSIKEDTDKARVFAFVKRICQICLHWLNIGTVAGMVYLLIELEKSIPEIRNLFLNAPNEKDEEAESGDEQDGESSETKTAVKTESIADAYDPKQRDPRFANAGKSSLWENDFFLNHYHPTVALYASSLLEGDATEMGKPDLGLYTLAHFLDKFVYRNAKQKPVSRGSSIMQPLGGAHTGALLVKSSNRSAMGGDGVPVNTRDWIHKRVEDVKPEDLFFHQYFSNKQSKMASSKFDREVNEKAQQDDEGSDLDDDQVWQALVKSNPDVEGDDEDEVDFSEDDVSGLSDMEMSDDDDDDEELANISVGDEDEDDEDDENEEGLYALNEADLSDDIEDGAEVSEGSEDSDAELQELMKGDSDDELDSEEIDFGSDDDEEEDSEPEKPKSNKRSRADDDKKSKRQKVKELPLFASADDYAEYLQSDSE